MFLVFEQRLIGKKKGVHKHRGIGARVAGRRGGEEKKSEAGSKGLSGGGSVGREENKFRSCIV